MNAEELVQLVDRARAAEGTPSQPPAGLLTQARHAAKRRRRAATLGTLVGAVVLVVAAIAVVPGWLGFGHPDAASPPSANNRELAAHGGPCPAVLPTATDDASGHGFGTDTPAGRTPTFTAPDTAWICQYGAREASRTSNGGTVYEWARVQDPRRLDDGQLTRVAQDLDRVGPETGDRDCPSDLGPRWLLVTSTQGDLTGTTVDDYGCHEVRLTADPFTTAPGDARDGGTVSGVLTGPDNLVTDLRSWWDTSPADTDANTPSDELHVTCADTGPHTDTTSVTAQPTGVVVVVDSLLPKGSYLTYGSAQGGPHGGDPAPRTPKRATYQFPPGALTLGCATPPGMDETGTATVTVEDPHGYWRDTTLANHGCRASSAQPSWVGGLEGEGATAEDAVNQMLENAATVLGRHYTAKPAPTGYSGADTQTWIAAENGVPALSLTVTRSGDHYVAGPDALCG